MNINHQKQITIVSDLKFALTRLDPAKHQTLIDLIIDLIAKFESIDENFDSLISSSISEIELCISENNLIVPPEISELIKSFSILLPN